jgi:hypothetical protein
MRPLDHSSISDISFGVLLLFCLLPSRGKACAKPNRRHKTNKWSATKDDFTYEEISWFIGAAGSGHGLSS